MSIEFTSPTEAKLAGTALLRVVDYVENHTTYRIVRDERGEFGLGTIETTTDHPLIERITVVFRPNDVYVAFHAASRKERESFLQILQAALAREGIESQFEEL